MGTFSELVLSFPLRPDVGPDVLAAFTSIAVPGPDAPELPAPAAVDDAWALDYFCDMTDPWSHDWGEWLAASHSSMFGHDHATMTWRRNQWYVNAHATWKSTPETFVANLAVLGTIVDASRARSYNAFVDAGDLQTGLLVGYTRCEYEPRPWLLWVRDDTLVAENLNPPNFFM